MDLDFDLDALERLLSEAEPSAPWRETKYGIITDDGTGTCVVSWDYAWGDAEGVAEGTLKPLIVAAVNALRALITRLRAAEDALRAIARGDARDVLLPQEGDRPPMANARDYFSGIVEANRWLKERLPDYDDSDVPALIVARAMLIDLNAERDAVLRAAEARAAWADSLALQAHSMATAIDQADEDGGLGALGPVTAAIIRSDVARMLEIVAERPAAPEAP